MATPPDPHFAPQDANTLFESAHMSDVVDTSYYNEESLQETHPPTHSSGNKEIHHVT